MSEQPRWWATTGVVTVIAGQDETVPEGTETFTVVRNGVTWPGLYASAQAAVMATDVDPEVIAQVWEVEGVQPLTVEDVEGMVAE